VTSPGGLIERAMRHRLATTAGAALAPMHMDRTDEQKTRPDAPGWASQRQPRRTTEERDRTMTHETPHDPLNNAGLQDYIPTEADRAADALEMAWKSSSTRAAVRKLADHIEAERHAKSMGGAK
jgi:hypothetical protein